MPFDITTWSHTWATILTAIALPLAIWAWFLADTLAGDEDEPVDAAPTGRGKLP
jgi:hypothetical protein